MKWLAGHTWLMVLIPLIGIIWLSGYWAKPLNLLKNTEVDYLDTVMVFALHTQSEGQERTKTIRYKVALEDGKKVVLYLQKDSLPMPQEGDILLVKTSIQRGDTLGDFDYGLYLRRQGIVGTAWARRGNWQIVGHQPREGIQATAERWQHRLYEEYQKVGIDGKELGVLSALTLGFREELDKDVQQSFSASGAMHVLAVSGLHTGIVWGILVWIFTLGGWRKPLYEEKGKRWLLGGVVLALLWIYAFITGLSPSVMRSALMLSFWELAYLLGRHTSRWNPILAAAVIILIVNPLALWSVSFQLSFAAVLGIMMVAQWMQQHTRLYSGWSKYIGGLVMVSMGAQLATMPLTLYYFGQMSNYFILTNLIVIPMAFVVLLLGFGTLAFSWCVVGEWLGIAAKWSTWLMRQAVEWIEALPYSTARLEISEMSAVCMYVALVFGILMMRGERVRWWWLLGVVGALGAALCSAGLRTP
ncbi:MAG: ComEC/Rec2 family competence protein [Paludibacteraceae bacterium]|nr:ComEC/Rec2 family competence protein [Paludibacteraceae bacterium]